MYDRDFNSMREECRKCLYSIQDVSANLEETDLYIQKYLPVRMQEMINESLKYFANSEIEKEKVLDYEVMRYKELHNYIINEPELTLDKKKPSMPSVKDLEKSLRELKKRNHLIKAYSTPVNKEYY